MKRSQQPLFDECVKVWNQASEDLDFAVRAPYFLMDEHQSFECVAYLPHFGGSKGMVVYGLAQPFIDTDRAFRDVIKKMNLYFSAINLQVYSRYNEAIFKEALLDWGYYGPEGHAPFWYKRG